jgi:hypothetical protein
MTKPSHTAIDTKQIADQNTNEVARPRKELWLMLARQTALCQLFGNYFCKFSQKRRSYRPNVELNGWATERGCCRKFSNRVVAVASTSKLITSGELTSSVARPSHVVERLEISFAFLTVFARRFLTFGWFDSTGGVECSIGYVEMVRFRTC